MVPPRMNGGWKNNQTCNSMKNGKQKKTLERLQTRRATTLWEKF